MAESTRLLNGRRESILTEGSNPSRSVRQKRSSEKMIFFCAQEQRILCHTLFKLLHRSI